MQWRRHLCWRKLERSQELQLIVKEWFAMSSGWNLHHARLVEDQGGGAHPVCPIIIVSFNNSFIFNAVEI